MSSSIRVPEDPFDYAQGRALPWGASMGAERPDNLPRAWYNELSGPLFMRASGAERRVSVALADRLAILSGAWPELAKGV